MKEEVANIASIPKEERATGTAYRVMLSDAVGHQVSKGSSDSKTLGG